MNDYYCLDIEFPNVDFNSFGSEDETETNQIYHAHLYTSHEEIELRIFLEDSSFFYEKLKAWLFTIEAGKFGSFVKATTTQNYTNTYLQKADFTESAWLTLHRRPDYYEGANKYIILKLDSVKLYFTPNMERVNTAEFYLDDKGFRVVEPFYGILGQKTEPKNDGKFEIKRKENTTKLFELEKFTFQPEFYFLPEDTNEKRNATIKKVPRIKFKYQENITEKEALLYADWVLLLASFYYHVKINYTIRKIFLHDSTVSLINISKPNHQEKNANLWSFGIFWSFEKFLKESCSKSSLRNFKLLSKAITQFNQALLVDSSSAFLIRYNIIEICPQKKEEQVFWNFSKKDEELKSFFIEVRDGISKIIDSKERELFNNKWNSIEGIIKRKSLKKQLEDSLISNRIDVKILPIKLSKIVQLRNDITHGSVDKINLELLRKANILLYRISGILILNLMEIDDWKLNTEIR
jgi:hypothetical protein